MRIKFITHCKRGKKNTHIRARNAPIFEEKHPNALIQKMSSPRTTCSLPSFVKEQTSKNAVEGRDGTGLHIAPFRLASLTHRLPATQPSPAGSYTLPATYARPDQILPSDPIHPVGPGQVLRLRLRVFWVS